jgi:CDP-diglyceride synthetase
MGPEILMTAMGICVSIFFFLFFAIIVLWIWSIVDCAKHEGNKNDRLIWILTILLLGIFGTLFYIFIRRKERQKQNNYELPLNRNAIISLILGGCGFCTFGVGIGIFLCIAGIIYGHIAIKQIRTGISRGREIAKSGLIMGYFPFAFILFMIAIILPFALIYGKWK